MFANEAAMHQWLRIALVNHTLSDLIANSKYLDEFHPKNQQDEKALLSFKKTAKALDTKEIISDDQNISLNEKDRLKPDFLLYSPEVEGIVIVELKNIPGPTRQAGTECGAYAGEVRSYLPFLPEGDMYYVLISSSWPVLLCHYIFHEIFWHRKNIICLEPQPFPIGGSLKIIDIAQVSTFHHKSYLCEQHMTGFQLCMYDDSRQVKNSSVSVDRLFKHRAQMEIAMSAMANEANQQRAHGFAFLWRDRDPQSLSPYNISIFNFSPLLSIERFLHEENCLLTDMQLKFLSLINDFSPSQGESIMDIVQTAEDFLETFCTVRLEGSGSWPDWKESIAERGDSLSFHGWGMFGDALRKALKLEYAYQNYSIRADDPQLGWRVVGEIFDYEYPFISLR